MKNIASFATGALDTKLLMVASAGFAGAIGFGALFFTRFLISAFGVHPGGGTTTLVSIIGVLYLGFAVLNWMARGNLIGGVYSRPVAMGNFAHFFGGTVVLVDQLTIVAAPAILGGFGATYALFTAGFGYVAFARGGSCG